MPATAGMTAEELLRLNLPNKRTELVRGVLVVREPAGYRHGEVAARLLVAIGQHVYARRLGKVFAAETGFTLERNPDTVRAPDVAFVRNERLLNPSPTGFAEIAPDLAVEVVVHDDHPGDVLMKVGDWLRAGAHLVWVVDAERRLARVYRADGSQDTTAADGMLDGESLLPELTLPLSALFD